MRFINNRSFTLATVVSTISMLSSSHVSPMNTSLQPTVMLAATARQQPPRPAAVPPVQQPARPPVPPPTQQPPRANAIEQIDNLIARVN